MPSQRAQPTIAFDEFLKLELRIGTIKACDPIPTPTNCFGSSWMTAPKRRQSVRASKRSTNPMLVGTQVLFIANLEPRTIRGEISKA